MTGIGRAIGASVAAAAVAAVAGGILLLLGLIVVAQTVGSGGGFDGTLSQEITAAVGEFMLFGIMGFVMGFLPALAGSFGVLLPLHFVLMRQGLTARGWYLAAGCAAGVISILVTRHWLGYLGEWVRVEGFGGLLAAAAAGGPVGGLAFRRIALARAGAGAQIPA